MDLMTAPGQTPAPFHPDLVPETRSALRPARVDDADQIHALIQAHLEEGHLLPRRFEELTVRAPRFVVAVQHAVVLTLQPQRSRA